MKNISKSGCPHILDLIETFEDEECFYIVTRVMAGGDLLNYLRSQKEQPLGEKVAKNLVL